MSEKEMKLARLDVASGLEGKLSALAEMGCRPAISRRGALWRAHINACGNHWAESAVSPFHAINKAISGWKEVGCPMDGRGLDVHKAQKMSHRTATKTL